MAVDSLFDSSTRLGNRMVHSAQQPQRHGSDLHILYFLSEIHLYERYGRPRNLFLRLVDFIKMMLFSRFFF